MADKGQNCKADKNIKLTKNTDKPGKKKGCY